ncbi:MAG: hypothetical protein Q9190_007341 [Brigantiaea leucoxantha]
MAALPYRPTTALFSQASSGVVYVLRPPTATILTSQLLALNTSTTIEAADLSFSTLSNSLPFLSDNEGEAYTLVMDHKGIIWAYTGICDGGSSQSQLWSFEPANDAPSIHRDWAQIDTSFGETKGGELESAKYLAAGAAFSSTNSTSSIYVFGGMCPTGATSSENWTESAKYSNSMVTLKPAQSSSSGGISYSLGQSASRGPPIPEAGFTMTPLGSSVSQLDGGNPPPHLSQNYVLLGGHTQQAFINMSQVALFSLPEESWTFLPVDVLDDTSKLDHEKRDNLTVEPRSGHTAVLSSDGRQIILFGGWVGDISTPANPQLAVLELGDGYGGSGDWHWSIPGQSGSGPKVGTGLYGHGAVMLPGNVMMVIGGYSIAGSHKLRWKRAVDSQNNDSYFYNLTANTWIPSYTPPKAGPKKTASASSGSQTITASQRAGLGAGLVFGILALLVVVMIYFWYARKLKRRREAYEEDLRNLASGGQRAHPSTHDHSRRNPEMTVIDHSKDRNVVSNGAYPWGPRNEGSSVDRPVSRGGETVAERTGLLFEIPSPTRGLRRSLHGRGSYQPAPRYDDRRRNHGPGNIHVIDEQDEDEDDGQEKAPSSDTAVRRGGYHTLDSAPVLDPFQDPQEVSRTPSPESPARQRELEIQKWMNDWAAADARLHSQADRLSQDKTDRTSSTLSDQSLKSNQSGYSFVGSVGRSLSQRSAALFAHSQSSAHATVAPSPTKEPQGALQLGRDTDPRAGRLQSSTLYPRRATVSNTGAASITQLQRESEALLGDYSEAGPSSPTRTHRRARGWMGSVRRVLTGGDPGQSTSPEHGSSASSSPTKPHHSNGGIPRRAASAGAMLWQRRQGAKDWDIEGGPGGRGDGEGSGCHGEEEEWDVESAVERRVVQVMFTVPREKLRVVNGAPEGDAESVISTERQETSKEPEGKGKERDAG